MAKKTKTPVCCHDCQEAFLYRFGDDPELARCRHSASVQVARGHHLCSTFRPRTAPAIPKVYAPRHSRQFDPGAYTADFAQHLADRGQ